MTVKELMVKLASCNGKSELMIIQKEELECMPEWWDDKEQKVAGKAIELYSYDLHSHEMYLLAIDE